MKWVFRDYDVQPPRYVADSARNLPVGSSELPFTEELADAIVLEGRWKMADCLLLDLLKDRLPLDELTETNASESYYVAWWTKLVPQLGLELRGGGAAPAVYARLDRKGDSMQTPIRLYDGRSLQRYILLITTVVDCHHKHGVGDPATVYELADIVCGFPGTVTDRNAETIAPTLVDKWAKAARKKADKKLAAGIAANAKAKLKSRGEA